jgi:hypothetical protein
MLRTAVVRAQELVERKNRDIVDFDIKIAKLHKKLKAAEESAW